MGKEPLEKLNLNTMTD